MIKKRTMWIVNNYDQEINSVSVLYDTKNKKVLSFKSSKSTNECYSNPGSNTKFYKTHDEAIAARKEHLKYLREMMPKVKAFLNEIDSISPTDDFSFNRSDYLPYDYLCDENYYRNRYQQKDKIINILTTVFRQQMLCVCGCTFPVSQVRRVNWYYGKAELLLSDGSFGGSTTISTRTDEEFEVVKILFGENTSGTTFKR